MRRNAALVDTVSADSILDYDQLQQIISKNQSFLRDFILVICCIIVFVILIMFILFIIMIATNEDKIEAGIVKRNKRLKANIDYRYA
ncbi:hypothetical protein [Ectropis obliqua nucleopolyhedrovirus]|uniref:Putative 11.8 kDa protein n=1 Tax=Ectropis obliqua nucleopolyhedrovirus TaxID=59376 RepID=A0EYY9_9ABAC|nr:hypothetical protein EONV_gp086 [Ectropis obliqua nucleopolyhedrovirus]ABI35769.1 hypothetical protein [Ectropis obliqua nucleopolyhedrovirus]AGS47936.1 putative 11.8 kDa protein [Ectropis obliqua nucleopolyhedrovirus]QWV59646.1 hypothetical protein EONV_gp086 [Ectropis obliqua nucleopolyhedrovirus]UYO72883.1 hypothetical protein EONV-gp086 [Ectropis obliqua nucleopolyhedrovirus]